MMVQGEMEKSLRDDLREYGLTKIVAEVYLTLLGNGALTFQGLLRRRIAAPEDLMLSLGILNHILLIGEQHFRDEIRYYATNPRISWRWQEFQFVWDRVLTLIPVDQVPKLESERDQERMLLLRRLQKSTWQVYAPRPRSSVETRRGRLLSNDGEYAHVCAEAISLAERHIVAVDSPPHTTATLPVFWSALTERCMSGVKYTRFVPIDEVFLHGLEIVARDLSEVGVDLRIVEPHLIRQRFYLVDETLLILRFPDAPDAPDAPDGMTVGRISYDKQKVGRLKQYIERLRYTALPAQDILPAIKRWAVDKAAWAGQYFSGADHRKVLTEIAQLGKFAEFEERDLPIIRDLLQVRLIREVDHERYSLIPPADASLALASSR